MTSYLQLGHYSLNLNEQMRKDAEQSGLVANSIKVTPLMH